MKTVEHLILTASAIAIGILLTRHAGARRWALGLASVMQTVPSLALFGFLIPIPLMGGIGPRTVIIALVLYALLPILRNTFVGIASVDPAVCESAIAMGMTDLQLLRQVQLPLATRTILTGIRVATVTTIGTATIAALIVGGARASGGLGIGMDRTKTVTSLMVLLALGGCGRTGTRHPIRIGSKNFT